MTFRRRCLLFVLLGVALAVVGSLIDPNALDGGGVVNVFGRLIAFIGVFVFIALLGVFPAINRAMMNATQWLANPYFLKKWQDSCDGFFGPLVMWYVGIDREGHQIG